MSGQGDVEPRVYRAGLALGSREAEAVVFDLPGCQCVAPDRASAIAVLPVAVAEHIAWLDEHGDVTRDAFPFEVRVVEEVDVASLVDVNDGEFCFEDDLKPSKREDVAAALRRLAYTRADLLRTVRHLPESVLDWQPPASALRMDDWASEARTIRRILGHIAGADSYYVGNISQGPPRPGAAPGVSPDLFEEREYAIKRLRDLSDGDMGVEFKKRQPWQRAGFEHWSVRKALRRMISHERFHTREIEQRLAWLLIGTPELAPAAVRGGA